MKLIFAQGNPSSEYSATRHNVGFQALDAFAREQKTDFKPKEKFRALIATVTLHGEKVLLVKPQTYYNLAGESYRLLKEFYKVAPEDTLIVHDELALPFGTLRVRLGGSDAGNNGIKLINQRGGEQSTRLRIGVANDQRAILGDSDFVLGRFSAEEQTTLDETILPEISQQIDAFIAGKHQITSQTLVEVDEATVK